MAETINKIETHEDDAVARLSGQFKEKPRIESAVRYTAKQMQDLEDAVFSILDNRTLANAEGPALDLVGSLVEQERLGFDDEFYRILIYVKIAENFSEGEPASIVQALKLILGATKVHYINLGTGSLALSGDGEFPNVNPSFVFEQLQRIVADGVKIEFISTTAPGTDVTDTFAFAGGPSTKGFATIAGTGGGEFADVVNNS